MVDTRSKVLKHRDRVKCKAVEDLPVEEDNSPHTEFRRKFDGSSSDFTICQQKATG